MNLEYRKFLIFCLVIITNIVFIAKLFTMQIIDDSWKQRAIEIAEKRREITPPRGVFYDRNMKKVVVNQVSYNLMIVTGKLKSFDTLSFAKLIGWKVIDVRKRIQELKKNEGTYLNPSTGKRESNFREDRPYPFIKDLTLEEITQLAPHFGDYNGGIFEEPVARRKYPFPCGATIFGYLSEVSKEEIKKDNFYRPGMIIGKTGVEKSYENILRGRKGVRFIVTDASAHEIKPYANKKYDTLAKPSPHLILGLDIELQAYGEYLLKHKRGCIVAIEPSSGDILAMVSSPSYDPNLLSGSKNIRKNYPKLITNQKLPLFVRPLQAEYPPGSILKILQSLICLQENRIKPYTGFTCNQKIVGCHDHPAPNTLAKALQYSCNPYFYYALRRVIQPNKLKDKEEDTRIGINNWYNYMTLFGLGQKLNVDFPLFSQRSGLIPNSTFYDRFFGKGNWNYSTISSIAIGQGEIRMTAVQMANLAAIVANRGWYITPHLVKSIGNIGPKPEFTKKIKVPVDKKHFSSVIEGMRKVVYEPGGTGEEAKVEGITVCGKTGTVQNGKNKRNHSVFIAFAPKENPKIALVVFVENAGGGGDYAAPLTGLMIEKYLHKQILSTEKEEFIRTH